jgi:hypothetical protein
MNSADAEYLLRVIRDWGEPAASLGHVRYAPTSTKYRILPK